MVRAPANRKPTRACNGGGRRPTAHGVTVAAHWVAHTRVGFRDVCGVRSARWLWAHLRAAFPRAYALCLMPNHAHLVVPGGADFGLFRRVLAQHGRVFGCAWDCESTACTTVEILLRAIRYVFINPVRDGRVADPWAWPWSTLRELGGAVDDDWTRAEVRAVTRGPWARVLARLTQPDAGPAPPRPRPGDLARSCVASFDAIAAAVASALRCEPEAIRTRSRARRLFVQLALAVGAPRRADLAAACGVQRHAIAEATRVPDRTGLRCALQCLQDDRLRIHDVPRGIALRRTG
jgi:hypothetical protein